MNVLILGSGGREHAFAWKISQSSMCKKLLIAPGNAGTAQVGININIGVNEFDKIKKLCVKEEINMIIVGPEEPLVNGIYDFFNNEDGLKHITVIGPSKKGAMLEGSKEFSKKFMNKYGIPTANYQSFTEETLHLGNKFLETLSPPYVLKADGLAAGKGVLIIETLEEAKKILKEMLSESKFGVASNKVIIEEHLKGIELSVFILTDGISYKILPSAKDYKRIGEEDTGLNTGGMGAISPVPFADRFFIEKVEREIVKPTVAGLREDAEKGEALFGTMDSYVAWHLTGGLHITDVTNASRTQLMDLKTCQWDQEILDIFEIPKKMLPETISSVPQHHRDLYLLRLGLFSNGQLFCDRQGGFGKGSCCGSISEIARCQSDIASVIF